jgi:PTS system mannitol-specific IIC component
VRTVLQGFGGRLSSMVMPNIGAFIAWGLITALFIPTGWLPNPALAALVTPTITYLLPVLIGYTGGRAVHGQRGAVVGAVATMGIAVGSSMPMFFGAMVVGPLSALLLRHFDTTIGARVGPAFKMLVDNFSAGILGAAMAVLGMLGIGPAAQAVTRWLDAGLQTLHDANLLPLVSIIVEPAKVLFLNNAVNHGILGPLGVADAAAHGKAIEFLIETNPGPGLGLLVACLLFGPRAIRPSVSGAIVIQFLGGIHEIYFPYVLARPRLLLATTAGGAAGVLTFMLTGAGTVATPSPGSIIAVLAVSPRGSDLSVVTGVAVSALVAFATASVLLRFGRTERGSDEHGSPRLESAPLPPSSTPPRSDRGAAGPAAGAPVDPSRTAAPGMPRRALRGWRPGVR